MERAFQHRVRSQRPRRRMHGLGLVLLPALILAVIAVLAALLG